MDETFYVEHDTFRQDVLSVEIEPECLSTIRKKIPRIILKKPSYKSIDESSKTISQNSTSSEGLILSDDHPPNSDIGLCRHNCLKSSCSKCEQIKVARILVSFKDRTKGICHHGRKRYVRKECFKEHCGGSGLCEHLREKNRCIDCGGADICKHKKRKGRCKVCKNIRKENRKEIKK